MCVCVRVGMHAQVFLDVVATVDDSPALSQQDPSCSCLHTHTHTLRVHLHMVTSSHWPFSSCPSILSGSDVIHYDLFVLTLIYKCYLMHIRIICLLQTKDPSQGNTLN